MQIKDIFAKDILRPINGVVMADQQDEFVVWQELEEYVVTKELDNHFKKFFEAYFQGFDSPVDPEVTGRMGIWVSGFFGSGKSHFIKILSYLISNREVRNPKNGRSRKAIDFFESKIKDPLFLADFKKLARSPADVILFNIDSKADARDGRGAVLNTFWRVFNEKRGFSPGSLHLAEIEGYLEKQNKYEEFRKVFRSTYGSDWEKERDAYSLLKDEIVEALSEVLGKDRKYAEEWFEKSEQQFVISPERFANQVKEYLDTKGTKHRIIFLVDEVGQFIGNDTHLMLNLQTLVEDLGRICQGRALVVVTSQEDIDAVIGQLKSAKDHDFSKIQGRFKTRISLSSSNTDEVIQIRLLEKKEKARQELLDLYADKGDIIKNQLSFTQDTPTFKNYSGGEDFVANYPFTPYQFQLVQKIFESIRKAGATGLHLSRGERSMLDAFQSAAKIVSGQNIGCLVPLYHFYPCIESFLDTSVKRSIEQAGENRGLQNPFDVQILQTLFLIRYVNTMKPTIDNLVTLSINEVDTDRLSLKRNIQDSLNRLEKENLISRNGDLYYFLTDEEREVSREIKNVEISSSEETKLLGEVIFDEILKGKNKHRYIPYRNDYALNRICDSQFHGSKAENELSLEFITPLFEEYSEYNQAKCILRSSEYNDRILIKIPDNQELTLEVRRYLQTEKFIRLRNDAAASQTLKQILRDKADENRQRKLRITALLDELILNSEYYVLGQSLTIKANKSQSAIEEALDFLIKNIFRKFSYLKLHDNPQAEIKAVLYADDLAQQQLKLDVGENPTEDLKEVMRYIDLKLGSNQPVLLDQLVNHFSKRDYGWPEWETVLIAAKLFMAGSIQFVTTEGENLSPKDALSPLTKTHQWKTVRIFKRKKRGEEEIKKARDLGKELFGTIGPDGQDQLAQFLKEQLASWRRDLERFQPIANTGKYPGRNEIRECLDLTEKLHDIYDSYEFIGSFNEKKNELLKAHDDIHDIKGFYTNQIKAWDLMQEALHQYDQNITSLEKDPEAAQSLSKLRQIFESPKPYGEIKNVTGLIAKVKEVNDSIVERERKSALTKVEEKINQLNKVLNEKKADTDLRNRTLYPIQEIKRKIGSETSVPKISYLSGDELTECFHKALEDIEIALQKNEDQPIKQVKTLKPASLFTKTYIETQDDVEEYLDNLRKELMDAIKNNKRVRLV
ncbi:MAG TPA: BREX system P-loop protein BrxC [Thermodesulfobacteriota bacterium]|nr:BREX system P-loop protein BrxC [Thermodesulfobacteriota bacterium]